ncbi:MAG: hypothetical protein ABI580_10395, partial [Burkholderiaceae bacterium]
TLFVRCLQQPTGVNVQLTQFFIKSLKTSVAVAAVILAGCADTSPIQPAASSKSQFEGAVYGGESVTVSASTLGTEEYRVFHQGSTGFVSVQSVRTDAEQRATEFCDRKGTAMKTLRETTSKPPHILGNYPRVEIIFGCVARPGMVGAPADDDSKYTKLLNLKKLLDGGVLTPQEFEREKAKVLSQP